jgi:hypothetical protein
MRLFYANKIDLSGVVFTPTSEQATLPVENLANEFRRKVWRTGTSTATERVVIDLGAATAITAVILLDHTLTAADSNILLEAHTSDSWGAPSFSQALTYAADVIGLTFASQNYRYWRLSFTKSAAGETRDIGRLFLGPYVELEEAPDYSGYGDEVMDLSSKIKSDAGQTYTDLRDSYRMLRYQFSQTPQTMSVVLKTFVDYVGQHTSFFVQTETSSPLNEYIYVKLNTAWGRQVTGIDSQYFWDFKEMEMEEQL